MAARDIRDCVEVMTVGDQVRIEVERFPGHVATLTMPPDTARWLIEELQRAIRRAEEIA